MSLKYNLSIKSIWVSVLLMTLIILGLYQIIGHSFLSQNQPNETSRFDILSEIPNNFNNFEVEIKSDSTAQIILQSKIDIQVELTISASVENLHLEWALKQDVNITQSDLPTEPISFDEARQSPMIYDAEFQVTGSRPHIIVQAYTLGDKGEKIGESAELYFNSNNGDQFLPNTPLENETKIRIDPSQIIR